ncbi:cell division cycle protein-like protein 23 [Hypoxylon cercidicola]|nr:cell division cycle protein-like protein 23 [Hypoxylon cercidicola]
MLNALPDQDTPLDEHVYPHSSLSFQTDPIEQNLGSREFNKFVQAKAFFDCHEFQRCASVFLSASVGEVDMPILAGATPDHLRFSLLVRKGMSQKALFLALHGLLMAGEKHKTEELGKPLGMSDNNNVVNKQMSHIKQVLNIWFDDMYNNPQPRVGDGFLEYLYGMILARELNKGQARASLVESVSKNPWNWGAWLELSNLVVNIQEFHDLQPKLDQHVMASIFCIYCRLKLHDMSASFMVDLTKLQLLFPNSQFLQGQRALMLYRKRNYEEASSIYWEMRISQPRSLDFVEHHSNLLCAMGSKPRSALLAQICTELDRFRPETCLVVRNYYSLIGRREDAITYFHKALTLDRNYAGAWVLLGEEYAKVENIEAATECHRRAVELEPHEYRALYGLGQCYERFDKPIMALHHYRRAVRVDRTNAELWHAVADCQIEINRLDGAIEALQSALAHLAPFTSGLEENAKFTSHTRYRRIVILKQMALIYRTDGNRATAIEVIQQCLDECSQLSLLHDTEQSVKDNLANSIIPEAEALLKKWKPDDPQSA